LEHASKFFGVSIDDSAAYSRAYRDGWKLRLSFYIDTDSWQKRDWSPKLIR